MKGKIGNEKVSSNSCIFFIYSIEDNIGYIVSIIEKNKYNLLL